jgi:hypothetical protein
MKALTSSMVAGAMLALPIVAMPPASAAPATAPVSASSQVGASAVSQQQAVRKAKSYLRVSAFSRSGLIKQLKFEGFSTKDATRAVDSLLLRTRCAPAGPDGK